MGAGVYGACNGLHMSPSLLERVRRDRLPVYICGLLPSMITATSEQQWRDLGCSGGTVMVVRGDDMGDRSLMWFFCLLLNRFQK